mmetsp:Transcript_20372/g.28029  ORF Transcript_20372/g.28029 Transcript_20372/m.28029 type:complete len:211 (-) Transcript_20372:394-1026(-)
MHGNHLRRGERVFDDVGHLHGDSGGSGTAGSAAAEEAVGDSGGPEESPVLRRSQGTHPRHLRPLLRHHSEPAGPGPFQRRHLRDLWTHLGHHRRAFLSPRLVCKARLAQSIFQARQGRALAQSVPIPYLLTKSGSLLRALQLSLHRDPVLCALEQPLAEALPHPVFLPLQAREALAQRQEHPCTHCYRYPVAVSRALRSLLPHPHGVPQS